MRGSQKGGDKPVTDYFLSSFYPLSRSSLYITPCFSCRQRERGRGERQGGRHGDTDGGEKRSAADFHPSFLLPHSRPLLPVHLPFSFHPLLPRSVLASSRPSGKFPFPQPQCENQPRSPDVEISHDLFIREAKYTIFGRSFKGE